MFEGLKEIGSIAFSIAVLLMVLRIIIRTDLKLIIGALMILMFISAGFAMYYFKIKWQTIIILTMALYPVFRITMWKLSNREIDILNRILGRQSAGKEISLEEIKTDEQEHRISRIYNAFENIVKNPFTLKRNINLIKKQMSKISTDEQKALKKELFGE